MSENKEDKLSAPEISMASGPRVDGKEKDAADRAFENYWYHYKWHTIAGAAIVIFLIICIAQLAGRSTWDAHILYTGPMLLDRESCEAITESAQKASEAVNGGSTGNPADYSGDGLITLDFNHYVYVPTSLAQEYKDNDIYFNGQDNLNERGNFTNAIMIGEYVILMIDRSLYEETVDSGAFLKWEDSLGYVPENAIDDYGILLADLPISVMNGFRNLPEDTVLCCRGRSYVNQINKKVQNEEQYQAQVALFRQLVTYERNG
ncbi:MAG: hypothetical protein MJ175_02685 [Clostridia bacterium]|nr:hypothetical protein [Clostridia bacterium]